jgi:aminoglycoside phosphotransferase family enzyme/predicted kinase
MTATMTPGPQQEVVAFMADPASYGSNGPVEHIETHISHVFLVGDRAFKIKRAVRYAYADFSTPELRFAACLKEVELNSQTAPELYLGTRLMTREADGRICFDGEGEMVDAAVEMVRFEQSDLLDRMALSGKLTPALMTEVTRMAARFHSGAPMLHISSGSANIAGVLDVNEAGFAAGGLFGDDEMVPFNRAFRNALAQHADLLDRREAAGKVRRCHGDLHLRNICMFAGAPVLFDCIEFNDQIATVDVLYDLAFLLMDLWHRGFPELANLVANRYLDEADDEDGFILLPFFMAVRAAVRAHVTAVQVKDGGTDASRLVVEARAYFDLAHMLLEEKPACLIAIGGLSGSGKTTVAEALAPHVGRAPGARIVESDRIRKAMHGVPPETRLPEKAYRPEVSTRVYREMAWRTSLILAEGGSVVADAVFDNPLNRARIESVASEAGVPFTGIWLNADPTILWRRVSERRHSASDATVDILSRQLQRVATDITWERLDAAAEPSELVMRIRELGAVSSQRSQAADRRRLGA